MTTLFDSRRYLTDFESARTGNILTDVLVIGSGVAGIRAALEAAQAGLVTLITKRGFSQSATFHAQGGIAFAQSSEDSPERHYEDTLRVGCGMNDPDALKLLVAEGPECLEELLAWGLPLDRDNGGLSLTREGGHSINRIVHAHGDQTGRALIDTLRNRVFSSRDIRVFEHCYVIDLITIDGACLGAVTYHAKYGHQLVWAKQTIIASGGCGQLWRETTNPSVATGDGHAAAFRAGATLRNMEMMQFHPTTLYVAGAARALISEAVRGEGGYLMSRAGVRFMHDYHPDAELAPRDIVSRAIHAHLRETRTNCVYLDVRHIKGFAKRFPHIAKLCADFDIDITHEGIPVRPSAHYMIGGIQVDLHGRTSVDALLCVGEAASTNVHGANRLASNSLLEGLVFGKRIGRTAADRASELPRATPAADARNRNPTSTRTPLDLPDITHSLRSVMMRNVGIIRIEERLRETLEILDFWAHYTLDKSFDGPTGWDVQNQLTTAKAVALAALERTESIGVHYRGDAETPAADATAPYHVTVVRDPAGTVAKRVPV
ncbi:MAG: L-aspartate oxidase [Planctomycetes bacterium]|nr:L-aspartate oxidase [Planctomycetota bacterium]